MKIKREHSRNNSEGGEMGGSRSHIFLLIVIPCGLIILASLVISGLVIFSPNTHEVVDGKYHEGPGDAGQKYYSHLSGLRVASKDSVTEPATCMMIENSLEARPQSGLRQAGVIYEGLAEGGITRLMALYQEESLPELAGPVRSVRMHFAQWAKYYECAIAHWGGAKDALNLIRNTAGYRDADQFFNPSAYWRKPGRVAPHNGYTSSERQIALNRRRGFDSSEFDGFTRAVGGVAPTRSDKTANNINITMSSALFNPRYKYDEKTNSYLRSYQTGGAHMDIDISDKKKQNSPSVVIAMMVKEVARPGTAHRNTVTTGSGTAHIFQNGEYIAGTWEKPTVNRELEFYTAGGEVVRFVPGQIWISAVPNGRAVTWK